MEKSTYNLTFHEAKRYVVLERTAFVKGSAFRSSTVEALDLLKSKQATKLVINDAKLGIISPEDQEWVLQEFNPLTKSYGITHVAVVKPEKSIGQMALKKIITTTASTSAVDYVTETFDTIDEAEAWIGGF